MSFAILLSALALAGSGPAPQADILVTGERQSERAVRQFIRDVGREAPGDQLARWDRAVCPYVTGLRDPHNAYIAGTITALAQAVGAEPGGEGCQVNLVLIVNVEPGPLVGELRQRHPWMFDSLQPPERRRLEESSEPARSWSVVTRRGSDGRILQRQGFGKSGLGEARTFGYPDTEILAGVLPSRIVRSTRSDLGASFILLDADRLEGLSLQQISGYAAMLALAQLDVGERVEPDRSILNLFQDADPPPEDLTSWDIAYLRALYASDNRRSAAAQRGQMARLMRGYLAEEE